MRRVCFIFEATSTEFISNKFGFNGLYQQSSKESIFYSYWSNKHLPRVGSITHKMRSYTQLQRIINLHTLTHFESTQFISMYVTSSYLELFFFKFVIHYVVIFSLLYYLLLHHIFFTTVIMHYIKPVLLAERFNIQCHV